MIELDPIRQAQLDHHAAERLLRSHLEAYRQARDEGHSIDTVRCAILLAQSYDDERVLFEQWQDLAMEATRAEATE